MNELKDPDDLGIMLRQTLRAREADAPGSSGLLADVRARISRRARARRRLAALGAVAAVVAAGTSAALLTSLAGSRNPPPALAAGTPHDLVVNGMRAWSFHGLQVRVPQTWPVNALMCGTPVKTTVEVDPGGIPLCRITEPPVVETVLLGTPQQVSMPPSHHQVTVGGQRGTLGTRRLPDGLTSEVLVLPGISAAAEADTRAPALAAAIIASARVVSYDANGCPSRIAALRPAGPPDRPGAAQQLVPGSPAQASVCHYTGNLLGHSILLPAAKVLELVRSLNALKPGLRTGDFVPGYCPVADKDGYILRFFYSSGPPLDVFLRIDSCHDLGADTGARTGGLTTAFGAMFITQIDGPFGASFTTPAG